MSLSEADGPRASGARREGRDRRAGHAFDRLLPGHEQQNFRGKRAPDPRRLNSFRAHFPCARGGVPIQKSVSTPSSDRLGPGPRGATRMSPALGGPEATRERNPTGNPPRSRKKRTRTGPGANGCAWPEHQNSSSKQQQANGESAARDRPGSQKGACRQEHRRPRRRTRRIGRRARSSGALSPEDHDRFDPVGSAETDRRDAPRGSRSSARASEPGRAARVAGSQET